MKVKSLVVLIAIMITGCQGLSGEEGTPIVDVKDRFEYGDCIDRAEWVAVGDDMLRGNQYMMVRERTMGGYLVAVCTGSNHIWGDSNLLKDVECKPSAIKDYMAERYEKIRCPVNSDEL